MFRILLALAAVSVAAMLAPGPAHAQTYAQIYPWCAEYSGGREGGGTNCGFRTLAQCRATISGAGGTCYENPAYPPATQGKARRKIERERY